MKVIIWKKKNGGRPEVYARENRLKDAKSILNRHYLAAVEFFDDKMSPEDRLYNSGKNLELFGIQYWIEQDQGTGYPY